LSKRINFTAKKPGSKAKRKKLYRKLLKEALSAHKSFESELKKAKSAHASLNIEPHRYFQLERLIVCMVDDVQSLINVIGYCTKRINDDEKTPSKNKTLSLSDKSAGFIKKGDRDPVIGYKPQIGRSKNGFIPAFQVPLGNAADSGEFLNIVTDGMERTGIVPKTISVDDGYASTDARSELLKMKIEVVSISGSKGKKIVGEEVWESKEYVEARNDRSAVESLMFTIKHNFNFGRVMRRGLENVRAELLEKVLAYNFCRMTAVRSRKKTPQDLDLAA
ncbi:MAG: transposase, partial [Desulfobacteraceae bacterium]|nr:transposase [Desulfobacteraceae bacterium]